MTDLDEALVRAGRYLRRGVVSADLPVASPQVFGDQTDVPESGDWWDAGYLIMWGSNVPVTRTPDAHWMTGTFEPHMIR